MDLYRIHDMTLALFVGRVNKSRNERFNRSHQRMSRVPVTIKSVVV